MDDDAQRRRCRETYGAMEKGPFSFPSPPFTLQPSGKIIHTYYDLYNHIDDWRDPVLYEETHNGDPVPYDERHLNGHVELVPTAPSRYSGPIQYSYLYDASSHPGGHIELVVPTAPSRPDIARYLAPLRYPAAPLLYSCDTSLVPAACSQGGRRYRGFDPGAGAPSSYPTALVPAACSRNGALEGGHDYWNMDTGAGAPSRCRGTDLGRAEGSRHRALEASRRSRHRALEASHRSRHGALEASRRSRSVDPGARERTRRRRSIDIDPAAPSRYQIAPSRHCRGAIRVGSSRSHHEVVEGGAASSGSHHGDSLYAGAAHHFGAAARYMEEAERRRRGGDPELGLDDAVLSGDGSDNDDSGDGCNGDGLCGLLLDVMCGGGSNELLALLFSLLFGMCIGADTDAGEVRSVFTQTSFSFIFSSSPHRSPGFFVLRTESPSASTSCSTPCWPSSHRTSSAHFCQATLSVASLGLAFSSFTDSSSLSSPPSSRSGHSPRAAAPPSVCALYSSSRAWPQRSSRTCTSSPTPSLLEAAHSSTSSTSSPCTCWRGLPRSAAASTTTCSAAVFAADAQSQKT